MYKWKEIEMFLLLVSLLPLIRYLFHHNHLCSKVVILTPKHKQSPHLHSADLLLSLSFSFSWDSEKSSKLLHLEASEMAQRRTLFKLPAKEVCTNIYIFLFHFVKQ